MTGPRLSALPGTPLRLLHVAWGIEPWSGDGASAMALSGLAAAQHRGGDRVTIVVPCPMAGAWPTWAFQAIEGARGQLGPEAAPFALSRLRHPAGFEVIAVSSEGRFQTRKPEARDRELLARAALYCTLHVGGRWDRIHAHGDVGARTLWILENELLGTPLQHSKRLLDWADRGGADDHGDAATWAAGARSAHLVRVLTEGEGAQVSGHGGATIRVVPDGLDGLRFDPANDMRLAASFGPQDLRPRRSNRADLVAHEGLRPPADGAVVGLWMGDGEASGDPSIVLAVESLLHAGHGVVVFASMSRDQDSTLQALHRRWPNQLAERRGAREEDLIRLAAGADVLWIPGSGRSADHGAQLARRYGALPILGPGSADRVGRAIDEVRHDAWADRQRSGIQELRSWADVAADLRP